MFAQALPCDVRELVADIEQRVLAARGGLRLAAGAPPPPPRASSAPPVLASPVPEPRVGKRFDSSARLVALYSVDSRLLRADSSSRLRVVSSFLRDVSSVSAGPAGPRPAIDCRMAACMSPAPKPAATRIFSLRISVAKGAVACSRSTEKATSSGLTKMGVPSA